MFSLIPFSRTDFTKCFIISYDSHIRQTDHYRVLKQQRRAAGSVSPQETAGQLWDSGLAKSLSFTTGDLLGDTWSGHNALKITPKCVLDGTKQPYRERNIFNWILYLPKMVAWAYDLNTEKYEAGGSESHPGLCSRFQTSLGYIWKTYLKKTKQIQWDSSTSKDTGHRVMTQFDAWDPHGREKPPLQVDLWPLQACHGALWCVRVCVFVHTWGEFKTTKWNVVEACFSLRNS